MNKFAFLYSTRFIALVIGALSIYLESKGYIGEPERNLIATIVAGFTAIRTVDRISDKQLETAEITNTMTTVSMPEGITSVQAKSK